MKTQKLLIFLLSLIVVISSCHKPIDPVSDDSMANLKVPSDFGWSVSKTVNLNVGTVGIAEGSTLALYDMDGNIIMKQRVFNNQASFNFRTKVISDSLRLYSSETRMSKYFLSSESDITFGSGSLKSAPRDADYALDFNRSNDDYVEIDNNGLGGIVVNYPFTFSAWFKTTSSWNNTDKVLVNIADPDHNDRYYGIYLRKQGSNWKPTIIARNGSEKRKDHNINMADDTWHQITGVFASGNDRTLYVDGVSVKTDDRNVNFNTDAVVLTLGRWGDSSPNSYFDGLMDNVCVWSKALSDAEVMNYYTNLPTGSEANLDGYWGFNEGSGSDVLNTSTSGGYDGVNSGADYVLISDPIPDTDGDGVNDDDDDFPLDPTRAYLSIKPVGNDYYYEMYEDLWPSMGDYDFNDVILKVKLHTYTNAQNHFVGGRIKSDVYWIGGSLPGGAGLEWFSWDSDNSELEYMPSNSVVFTQANNVIDDQVVNNAVQIFDGNLTESLNDSVDFEFTWDYNIGGNGIWIQVYIYTDERNHEVHTYGNPPTNAEDMSLFGTFDDASLTTWDWSAGNIFATPADFYKTSTNLPWGMEVITNEFRVPNEKIDIVDAYPQFKDWAESGGTVNQDWYNYPDESLTFLPN